MARMSSIPVEVKTIGAVMTVAQPPGYQAVKKHQHNKMAIVTIVHL